MLIATWVLACSTLVLAVGGPVAFLTWWKDKAEDRERARREQILREAGERFLKKDDVAKDKIASKDFVYFMTAGAMLLAWLVAQAAGKQDDGADSS